jgi:hypothetical protein
LGQSQRLADHGPRRLGHCACWFHATLEAAGP